MARITGCILLLLATLAVVHAGAAEHNGHTRRALLKATVVKQVPNENALKNANENASFNSESTTGSTVVVNDNALEHANENASFNSESTTGSTVVVNENALEHANENASFNSESTTGSTVVVNENALEHANENASFNREVIKLLPVIIISDDKEPKVISQVPKVESVAVLQTAQQQTSTNGAAGQVQLVELPRYFQPRDEVVPQKSIDLLSLFKPKVIATKTVKVPKKPKKSDSYKKFRGPRRLM